MGYDDVEYLIWIISGILGNGKRKCEWIYIGNFIIIVMVSDVLYEIY